MSKMILTLKKNCQGQILIDQYRSEFLEEIMRYSFLVKLRGPACNFITSLTPLLVLSPPPFLQGERVQSPTKFSKREGLTGPSFLKQGW